MTATVLTAAAPAVAGAVLHALRILPVALLSPALGGPLVPGFVRAALALALGGSAWAASGAAPAATGTALLPAAARELALGACFGLVSAAPFEAARAAGRLADTLRGATLSELHVAPLRQRETALGDLLVQQLVALAAVAGGGRLVTSSLLGSFVALPAGGALPARALLGPALDAAGAVVSCALCVGAPAAAGVLAAELTLAVALRNAPPGMSATAAPARAAAGLLALAAASSAAAGRLTAEVALSAARVAAVTAGAGGVLP